MILPKLYRIYQILRKPGVYKKYEFLKECQWWAQDEIIKLQQVKLKALLHHAYNNVPYYSNLLQHSGVIKSEKSFVLDSFYEIPFLEKSILKNSFKDLKSIDINNRKWYKNSSGGSTGETAVFIQDNETKEWAAAITKLRDDWSGYRFGEAKVLLWGSERDLLVGNDSSKVRVFRKAKNMVSLNAFDMSEEKMYLYVRKINEVKPVQIKAYAESIFELARFVKINNMKIHSPRAIISAASPLHSHMRELIIDVFKAPVFNVYGSRETGGMATECSYHMGFHISMPTHFIEIVRSNGEQAKNDEEGEIVVTTLVNYSMPLIRYKIGDMGVFTEHKCTCGRSWKMLKKITGRTRDYFVTPDGRRVNIPTKIFQYKDWIRRFQVVQEQVNLINIFILKEKKYTGESELIANDIKNIKNDIIAIFGESCSINVRFVDEIKPSPSGKYNYLVSKVRMS